MRMKDAGREGNRKPQAEGSDLVPAVVALGALFFLEGAHRKGTIDHVRERPHVPQRVDDWLRVVPILQLPNPGVRLLVHGLHVRIADGVDLIFGGDVIERLPELELEDDDRLFRPLLVVHP